MTEASHKNRMHDKQTVDQKSWTTNLEVDYMYSSASNINK